MLTIQVICRFSDPRERHSSTKRLRDVIQISLLALLASTQSIYLYDFALAAALQREHRLIRKVNSLLTAGCCAVRLFEFLAWKRAKHGARLTACGWGAIPCPLAPFHSFDGNATGWEQTSLRALEHTALLRSVPLKICRQPDFREIWKLR
jgi:hypothetical protein